MSISDEFIISNQEKLWKKYKSKIIKSEFNAKNKYSILEGFEDLLQASYNTELSKYKNNSESNLSQLSTNVANIDTTDKYRNVFVSSNPPITSEYIGCYADASDRTMNIQNNGDYIFNYDTCKTRAIDSSNTYFALQNTQPNGLSQCLLSEDLSSIQSLGTVTGVVDSIAWSLHINFYDSSFILKNNGDMELLSPNNGQSVKLYDDSNIKPLDPEFFNKCSNDGAITVLMSNYGINCNIRGDPSKNTFNVPSNNLSVPIAKAANGKSSYLYNVGVGTDGVWSDPAPGCWKSFNLSYQCGKGSEYKLVDMPANHSGADYKPVFLDCRDVVNSCKCYLIIQDDGELCIYAGSDPKNNSKLLFTTTVKNLNKIPNPKYSANKGKTGVNYILSGSGLMGGEWIGSNDGSTRLRMTGDGSLQLVNSIKGPPLCNLQSDGNYGGGSWANAVYKNSSTIPKGLLGSFGYIDSTGSLKKYPSELLEPSNTYTKNEKYSNNGSIISTSYGSTSDDCANICNSTNGCLGYNFINDGSNACVLTSSIETKTPSDISDFYLRNMELNKNNVSSSCLETSIENIDTSKWSTYTTSTDMTSNDNCNLDLGVELSSSPNLDELANSINTNTANFKTQNKSYQSDISKNTVKNIKNLIEYGKFSNNNLTFRPSLPDILNKKHFAPNTLENFKDGKELKTIHESQNLNITVEDTKLVAIMYNYQFYLWIFLILIIILILFKIMKK